MALLVREYLSYKFGGLLLGFASFFTGPVIVVLKVLMLLCLLRNEVERSPPTVRSEVESQVESTEYLDLTM